MILTAPDDGRFSTLRHLLLTETFHLIFLSGHGAFQSDPLRKPADKAVFFFEKEDGLTEGIAGSQIAERFIGSAVQCVVVSACQSGKTASDDLSTGLSTQLAQIGEACEFETIALFATF